MAKRGNGEGTIRKDEARKRWEGRVTIGRNAAGKVVRKKVTGRTRAEVVDRMKELADAADAGREMMPRTLSVERFLEDWLDNVLPGTVAPVTEAQYRQTTRLYIVPNVGRKQLRTLQPRDVTGMLRNMEADGLSANSQRLARAVLRRALRWAEINGYVSRNVAALAHAPKVQQKEGKALTPEQARTLLTYLADTSRGTEVPATPARLEAAITVALSLGLRRAEVLGLAWSDLELDTDPKRLTVRYSVKRIKGTGLVRTEPKTRQSRRTIHLPAPVAASLKRHRVRQAEERLKAGDLWDTLPLDADLVFRTETGEAIDPNNFGRDVRKATKGAGLPGSWSPHSLRHSAASLLLAQGVPLKVISEVLGHSSIRVTADVYSHLMEPAKVEAADAMTEALWGEA